MLQLGRHLTSVATPIAYFTGEVRTVGKLGRFVGVMGNSKGFKHGSKRFSKQHRMRKQSREATPVSKSTTRLSDVYEAEENEPQEEIKAGQRYDVCEPLSSLLASRIHC